jgi:hypothetical protein
MTLSRLNTVVNVNDNHRSSWLHQGDWASKQVYAKHIPLANRLIASSHCKEWWKNHPETWEYMRAQFAICCQLCYPEPRLLAVGTIALYLGCSPVALLNDSDLGLDKIL